MAHDVGNFEHSVDAKPLIGSGILHDYLSLEIIESDTLMNNNRGPIPVSYLYCLLNCPKSIKERKAV